MNLPYKGAFYGALFSNISRILHSTERKKFTMLIILNMVISILDIASIALLFVVIRFYASTEAALPTLSLTGFNLSPHSLLPALLLLLFFAAKSFGGYYVYKIQYRFAHTVSARLSETALLQYMEGSYENHVNNDAAVLVRKIIYAPTEFAQFILLGSQQLLTEAALIALSVTALLLYNIKLLAIVSLTLLPAVFLLSYITKKRLTGIRQHIKTVNEQALQYLHEALHGFIESNVYHRNDVFVQRYAGMQRTVGSYIANLQITQGIPSRFFEVFAVLGLFLLIVAMNITGHATDIIVLGAFVAAAYKIIPGISRIINLTAQIHTYDYAIRELVTLSGNNPEEIIPQHSGLQSVSLTDITLAYNSNVVVSGIQLQLKPGTFLGISGNSGRGKTTLLHLLLGFLTPQQGNIVVNGKATTATERKAYWHNISYVKQDPFLVHDSILNNIVLFNSDYNKEKLDDIIQVTGLNNIIDKLPAGLHTIITEGGRNLSGGQRQRIAIARALYKDADLVLLDEPFNELDEASEKNLLQYLQQLAAAGKMIIFITHSSASLTYCNSILYMDEA